MACGQGQVYQCAFDLAVNARKIHSRGRRDPESVNSQLVAALVTASSALSTFLRPDARAKKFNAARSILRRARNEYEHSNNPLVKALNEADELTSHE
jgi:hypothetical protein